MVKNLKALRLERGVSQQQLADAIFVTQPSIHKYETQNIEPEIAILIRMADYFGTSLITLSVARTAPLQTAPSIRSFLLWRRAPCWPATAACASMKKPASARRRIPF